MNLPSYFTNTEAFSGPFETTNITTYTNSTGNPETVWKGGTEADPEEAWIVYPDDTKIQIKHKGVDSASTGDATATGSKVLGVDTNGDPVTYEIADAISDFNEVKDGNPPGLGKILTLDAVDGFVFLNSGNGNLGIGVGAGESATGSANSFLGRNAGGGNTGSNVTSLGAEAGQTNTGNNSVQVGVNAGKTNSGASTVHVGQNAGTGNTQSNHVAVGPNAGTANTGSASTQVGVNAGQNNSGSGAIQIGNSAGQNNNQSNQVAIGTSAGQSNTSANQVAIGQAAGKSSSGGNPVQIGVQAGENNTGGSSVQVGVFSGQNNTGESVTQVGSNAGRDNAGTGATQVGNNAGRDNTADGCTMVGNGAGQYNSGEGSTMLGSSTGVYNTAENCLFVGASAGKFNTGIEATQIGANAGTFNTGDNTTLVGLLAGYFNRSDNVTAIGQSSGRGAPSFSATGVTITASTATQVTVDATLTPAAGEIVIVDVGANSTISGIEEGTFPFEVVDASTLKVPTGLQATIVLGTSGSTDPDATISQQPIRTNMTYLGHDSVGTANDQAVIGNPTQTPAAWSALSVLSDSRDKIEKPMDMSGHGLPFINGLNVKQYHLDHRARYQIEDKEPDGSLASTELSQGLFAQDVEDAASNAGIAEFPGVKNEEETKRLDYNAIVTELIIAVQSLSSKSNVATSTLEQVDITTDVTSIGSDNSEGWLITTGGNQHEISGLLAEAPTSEKSLTVFNADTGNLIFKMDSQGDKGFYLPNASDLSISIFESVTFTYSTVLSRWIVSSLTTG